MRVLTTLFLLLIFLNKNVYATNKLEITPLNIYVSSAKIYYFKLVYAYPEEDIRIIPKVNHKYSNKMQLDLIPIDKEITIAKLKMSEYPQPKDEISFELHIEGKSLQTGILDFGYAQRSVDIIENINGMLKLENAKL